MAGKVWVYHGELEWYNLRCSQPLISMLMIHKHTCGIVINHSGNPCIIHSQIFLYLKYNFKGNWHAAKWLTDLLNLFLTNLPNWIICLNQFDLWICFRLIGMEYIIYLWVEFGVLHDMVGLISPDGKHPTPISYTFIHTYHNIYTLETLWCIPNIFQKAICQAKGIIMKE